MKKEISFGALKGLVLYSVEGLVKGSDKVVFKTTCGRRFYMEHVSDCCEDVGIEEISGDVAMLLGRPIIHAEERSNRESCNASLESDAESYTWTFYSIATVKGAVDIRWFGSSNGYYSESVDFVEAPRPKKVAR